ncbi:MAG: YdcF family protein [Oscillospiraceae bacterium]|nr:YdcF family protein [Oscillospiraceae bacterium]
MKRKRLWAGLTLLALAAVFLLIPTNYAMTGLVLGGYGTLCLADWWCARQGWRRGWHWAIVAVGAAVFAVLAAATAWILSQGRSQWDAARQADYAVVLGAQVRGDQPSRTLRERLELTRRFLAENPAAVVIVSGGQGPDEAVTEASAMYAYLEASGADMRRVYKEEEAHDTRQNLQYAAALAVELGLDPARPVIITSDFHLCRAKYIAGTLGLEPCGIGSRTTPWYLALNYGLREVFAFVKAWYVAN